MRGTIWKVTLVPFAGEIWNLSTAGSGVTGTRGQDAGIVMPVCGDLAA